MDQESMSTILDILKIIAALIAIIGSASWIWEYRLKVRAERRLTEAAEIEAQIKLLRLFTEMMAIAHARGGYKVSEKALEKILTPETLVLFKPGSSELKDLLRDSLISIPVGEASQDAAIASIWKLGKEHDILRSASIRALTSLCSFKKDVAKPYLDDLNGDAQQAHKHGNFS